MSAVLTYEPAGPTLVRFHNSNARRRIIIGPIRSGKTHSSCWEIFMRACEQAPDKAGARRTRWAVIRATYGDLERTTIATWKSIFGAAYGFPVGRKAGIVHELRFPLADGTRVEADVIFMSLDHEQDVSKLLSLELTGAFVNEARELPQAIFMALDDRVGWYPSKADGGPTWSGWWCDTNPPDDTSWIYRFAEEERPAGWKFFKQPGGLIKVAGKWQVNPAAENMANHMSGQYYLDQMSGKSDDHIRVYYGCEYGFVIDGRLVCHEFSDEFHTAKYLIEFDKALPIYVGLDFGATPAAALLQKNALGQWLMIEEMNAAAVGIDAFTRDQLKPRMQELSGQGYRFTVTGDPAGSGTSQTDGRTPFQIMNGLGVTCTPSYTNDFDRRRAVIAQACGRVLAGQPGFLLSPACKVARIGLAKAYVLRKVGTASHGEFKYQQKPDKNAYSHIVDAIMYGMMGAGEGRDIGINQATKYASGPMPARRIGSIA